jgi:hypothetical protein
MFAITYAETTNRLYLYDKKSPRQTRCARIASREVPALVVSIRIYFRRDVT